MDIFLQFRTVLRSVFEVLKAKPQIIPEVSETFNISSDSQRGRGRNHQLDFLKTVTDISAISEASVLT